MYEFIHSVSLYLGILIMMSLYKIGQSYKAKSLDHEI